MKRSAFLFALAVLAVVEGVCHDYEKDYYKDIGCKAQDNNVQGCPTSYDCSMLKQRSQEKCYYQGKTFEAGQQIENSREEACVIDCKCIMSNNKSVFNCIRLECQGDFNIPLEAGCYRTYEHGTCCSVDKICDDPAKQKTLKEVCEYGGQSYQLGQRFYPDEDSCLSCICQSGFNAEATDSVLPGDKRTDSSSNPARSCQFGNITMNVGDKLSPSKESSQHLEWECTCRVPPHPVCIQKENSPL